MVNIARSFCPPLRQDPGTEAYPCVRVFRVFVCSVLSTPLQRVIVFGDSLDCETEAG